MNRLELHKSIVEKSEISFARSGGKGGQNVNKVNTKVHLSLPVHDIAGVTEDERIRLRSKLSSMINKDDKIFIDADDERFQERNKVIAFERLESKIVKVLATHKKRTKTKPTEASRERRLKLKKIKSEIKKNRGKISI